MMPAASPSASSDPAPGRRCPVRYRYGPAALADAPEQAAETLYVIGGLYGNQPALAALRQLAALEAGPVSFCFNGDFNWFNVDDAGFVAINEFVLGHDACLGNVEAELLSADDEAGCGCAYPESVDAATVERSNRIHRRLKRTALGHPQLLRRLGELPMVRRYRIGDHAIGVVHGDAESLAGWRFDPAALDDPANRAWIDIAFAAARVDAFASSHTCLPALRRFDRGWVINNGAAGMPNFEGRRSGVVTRIAVSPAPTPALYGGRLGRLYIEALALDYVAAAWESDFLANWPPGSPAHVSYWQRITDGPDHALARAAPISR